MSAGILITFAALVAVALLLAERGINSAAAPLAAVCATVLFFTVLGFFGGLQAAGWLYHILALAAVGWLVWRWAVKKEKMPSLGIGFWFFVLGGLGIIVLLWAKQPMFFSWDEFSTWGTAAKLTKIYNVLYSNAPVGWPWAATQPPALANFTYFMQFWGREFSEWQMYAAYDILQFAAIAALLRPFEKKQWNIAAPVLVIALVTPFMLALYRIPMLVGVYLTSYSDIPLALLFAAALGCYFGAESKDAKSLLALYLVLPVLTLTKDLVGVALALVVAVLVLADMLLEKQDGGLKKRLLRAFGRFGLCAGGAVAAFGAWSVYLSVTLDVDRGNLGGGANLTMGQMPVMFLKEVFGSEKSEKFRQITGELVSLFFNGRITFLGTGLIVMGLCLGMIALAAFITKDAPLRRRCLLAGIFVPLGFVAYYVFMMMYYLYIFTDEQNLVGYERYVYPYYIGFFLLAVLLLAMAARRSRFVVEGKAAILLLCAVLCLRYATMVPSVYTLWGVDSSEFDDRREFAAAVDDITARLPEDSRTFIISSDDDGLKWFTYCYEFLPWQVDYSYGGGSVDGHFVVNEKLADGSVERHLVSPEDWAEYLIEQGCDTIFVDQADEAFIDAYGYLFSDGMREYVRGEENLYHVYIEGDGVRIEPFE